MVPGVGHSLVTQSDFDVRFVAFGLGHTPTLIQIYFMDVFEVSQTQFIDHVFEAPYMMLQIIRFA